MTINPLALIETIVVDDEPTVVDQHEDPFEFWEPDGPIARGRTVSSGKDAAIAAEEIAIEVMPHPSAELKRFVDAAAGTLSPEKCLKLLSED
jgi:hypothetical protein